MDSKLFVHQKQNQLKLIVLLVSLILNDMEEEEDINYSYFITGILQFFNSIIYGNQPHRRIGYGPGRGRVYRSPYRRLLPRNFYNELRASPTEFKHRCNFSIEDFDDLHAELQWDIMKPRNVHGHFSEAEQAQRTIRGCKLDTKNRLLLVQ